MLIYIKEQYVRIWHVTFKDNSWLLMKRFDKNIDDLISPTFFFFSGSEKKYMKDLKGRMIDY